MSEPERPVAFTDRMKELLHEITSAASHVERKIAEQKMAEFIKAYREGQGS